MSEEDDAFYEFLRRGGDLEPPSDDYVRFDEREDVLASMDLLELITPLLGQKPALWKWAIIGAQSALQGALVCALADTTGTSILTPKSGGKLLDWLQQAPQHTKKRPYIGPRVICDGLWLRNLVYRYHQ